ncbi:MAG: SpoIIE family protein phosphatase [Bacteroidetes bacterium]|nr:SpoIIE family protein phosphatase [Bacteroidota bacterium]
MKPPKKYLIFIFVLAAFKFFSQTGEFFINNYLPKEYKGGNTNFGIVQNKEGLIFSANSSGVLIYDGYSWKNTKIQGEPTITSISISNNNEIFIGCDNGDFGVFNQDKRGIYQFFSFKNNIPGNFKPGEPIKFICSLNDKTYFLSEEVLIEYAGGEFKTFLPVNRFHIRPIIMGKHLFIEDMDNGLLVLSAGVLKPVVKTEALSTRKYYFTYKLSDKEYAIGFRGLGMFKSVYNATSPELSEFTQINDAPCNTELIEAEIVNGFALNNGNFVVTSNKAGAFILDKELKIINRLNSKTGVYDENIKAGYEDVNGNIWLALNYGISFVEVKSPLRKFTRKNGINGVVQSSTIYNNVLYIATDKGVFYFDSKDYLFKQLDNFNEQTWYILNYQNKLFFSSNSGLYVYNGKTIKTAHQSEYGTIYYMLNDPYQPNVLYCGHDNGVDVLNISGEKTSYIKSYILNTDVRSLASDNNKNIYFGTSDKGIYFLNYKNSYLLDSLQLKDGLPDLKENYVFSYNKKLLVGTDEGIYSLEEKTGNKYVCIKDPQLWSLTSDGQIFRAAEFKGDVICNQTAKSQNGEYLNQSIYLKKQDNGFSKINSSLNHLKYIKANLINYDTLGKQLFISCDEGLFLLNGELNDVKKDYRLFISSIEAKTDTVIQNIFETGRTLDTKIGYSKNDIKIFPGFTSFEDNNLTEFSYYLKGKEEKFTDWKKGKEFKYDNLQEGDYTFYLKARNAFSNDIKEINFSFTILPPWYRTWWAYTIYFIIFCLFIYIVVRLYTKRLKSQNIKLEETVKLRTATIEEQVHLLADQKKEITDSINYAQRIQESVLPSLKEIDTTYHDGFIFFQPKDIVSGDFYWFYKINNNEFLIACADCTGHGVPGAFMSMICSNKLSEACFETTEPAKILFLANNAIKDVLKQNVETIGKSKDGMEIALIKYNIQTKKVTYTGAHRPLWIIKAGTKEFVEIKPTKASVASFTEYNFEYQQHEIELETNDSIFMTSDGFPDQFGGADGKKFMAKNMKAFLQEISTLPTDKQKIVVADKINNWMGPHEQVDDLLVIGLKVN